MTLQQHNVSDTLKELTIEERKASIKRFPVALASFCVRYDVNIGNLIRNSNAFACSQFIMIGDKKWDRRPAVGTQNYEEIIHVPSWAEFRQFILNSNHKLVIVDYKPGVSYPISKVEKYPDNPIFLMGCERSGVPDEAYFCASFAVHIQQYGSVRSLNVATASGIILYDWHVKHEQNNCNR
jgi:tRNA G18 (ribose-2'-O)-methylase SpoU